MRRFRGSHPAGRGAPLVSRLANRTRKVAVTGPKLRRFQLRGSLPLVLMARLAVAHRATLSDAGSACEEGQAAVDAEHLAVDEPALLSGEERHRVGNFARLGVAVERLAG